MSNPRELPILFNAAMVRALLAGTKTQTRRPAKISGNGDSYKVFNNELVRCLCGGTAFGRIKPQYQIGDRLYVRETFIAGYDVIDGELQESDEDGNDLDQKVWYAADKNQNFVWHGEDGFILDNIPWKPSIHMPKWAARIWLEVVDVRVERVQDITPLDAVKEGLPCLYNLDSAGQFESKVSPKDRFKAVWDSIYKNWNNNPWVFVYEFKVVSNE